VYIPPANAEHDVDTLFAFIAANPLGALVTQSANGELVATHLPWIVHREAGEHDILRGHIARANTEHRRPGDDASDFWQSGLVIFTGPDAYISPSWYAAKAEHGRVVPTWNYVAVHATGRLRFVTDDGFLRKHVQELVGTHEAGRAAPWSIDDAPSDYIARQLKAIVGVEFEIQRLEGKWKMSQNRSAADIDGVVEALERSTSRKDREVGQIVAMRKP
jgi:transcriptional regulator